MKFFYGETSIAATCSLALSRSERRLESFRISKFSASFLTSSGPDVAESVDFGEHEPLGLGANGVTVLGSEAK